MVQLGKRYQCEACGTMVLCTKAGEGMPACCDKEMQVLDPKPLPSAD
ncbi:desulforedoxin [Thermodesulfobacteriota bacterium]